MRGMAGGRDLPGRVRSRGVREEAAFSTVSPQAAIRKLKPSTESTKVGTNWSGVTSDLWFHHTFHCSYDSRGRSGSVIDIDPLHSARNALSYLRYTFICSLHDGFSSASFQLVNTQTFLFSTAIYTHDATVINHVTSI